MVTVSIVSHGHGKMVAGLAEDLLACAEVSRILITQNIAEDVAYPVTLLRDHPDFAIITDENTAQPALPRMAA
jgi:hypothetical protein